MKAEALVTELRAAGIRVIEPRPNGNLFLAPKSRLTAELIERVRAAKATLLAHLRAEQGRAAAAEALAMLQRLEIYTLPAGRMEAAREIAERYRAGLVRWENGEPFENTADEPAAVLAVLKDIERELVALGGAPDPELADVIDIVGGAFPGARLVDVRKLQ